MKKQLRNVIAQRSQRRLTYTDQAILQFPHLKDYIEAWPDLAHSLIDTGRVNELSVSDGAYINTGLRFGPDTIEGFGVRFTGKYDFTPSVWNIHGISYNHNTCCIGFSPSRYIIVGDGDNISELRYAPEFVGDTFVFDMRYSADASRVNVGVGQVGLDGYRYAASIAAVRPTNAAAFHLFHCNGQGSTFSGTMREATFTVAGTEHRLVPYQQSGRPGLLDLTDLTFHGNESTRGQLSIATLLRGRRTITL